MGSYIDDLISKKQFEKESSSKDKDVSSNEKIPSQNNDYKQSKETDIFSLKNKMMDVSDVSSKPETVSKSSDSPSPEKKSFSLDDAPEKPPVNPEPSPSPEKKSFSLDDAPEKPPVSPEPSPSPEKKSFSLDDAPEKKSLEDYDLPKKEDLKDKENLFETPVDKQNKTDALSKLKSLEKNPDIKESEIQGKSSTLFEKQEENIEGGVLITKYGETKIYKLKTQSILHYSVPVPKPNPSQKIIINTLKEATTRLVSSDPYKIRDPLQRKNIYYQKVLDILETAQEINIPKHMYPFYADAVVKEMTGYGVIEPLLQDDKLEEIMIVGPKKPVYVYHVDYGMMTTNITFFSDDGVNDIIDKIARSIGRNVDIANPLLDARLPDGSRVNATVPPASIDGSTVTIRKFREDPYTIVDLVKFKTLNLEVAAFLWCVTEGFGAKPANILISGGTGSGKTTTLNVLANFIPESDRILTIEDTAELKLPIKHVIRFEGRPPGLEGKGELSLEILTKNTLRMRPDRIIVGEIRHKEATTLFTAMNTGHDGCMGTVHANSAKETIVRLTSPPMDVPPLMLAGIDFIIIQKRLRTSKGQVRRITSISEIRGVLENDPKINLIFVWNPETDTLERTKEPIYYFDLIKSYTNLTDSDIKERILQRAKILQDLSDKKIRSISDVAYEIQKEYILKR